MDMLNNTAARQQGDRTPFRFFIPRHNGTKTQKNPQPFGKTGD
jgi:hypothetical protein